MQAAEAAGIGITGLTERWFTTGPGGLVFGYGGVGVGAIDDGVRRLAEIIEASTRPT